MMVRETNFGKIFFGKEWMNQSDIMKAEIIPIKGAKTIKATVFKTGSGLTAVSPACAIAAPANPPIRVCEEDDGMPYHQVSRFQRMDAMRPDKITSRVMKSTFTVLAMVLATPCSLKIKKAAKLKNAAHNTA